MMRRVLSLVFTLAIIVLGVSFSILNADKVSLNLYIKTWQLPLSLALVLSLVLGFLLGLIVASIKIISLKHKNSKLQKQVLLAEKEVSNLRTIPIKDVPL